MRRVRQLNYLHYGDALELLSTADLSSSIGNTTELELASSLLSSDGSDRFLGPVIKSHRVGRSRRLNLVDLQSELRHSHEMQAWFSRLGCRGFSHTLYVNMAGFPYRLRRQVNIRIGIVADRQLFYPPRVREYVARHSSNHYFVYDSPAIAFALGCATKEAWYIFVLQSDLVRRGPSAVREHFRGWRKVLFADILKLASKQQARRLYLCREDDVLRACHDAYPKPMTPPSSWKAIYSGTASDFGMDTVNLRRGINIQLYAKKRAIYARRMYWCEPGKALAVQTRPGARSET